MGDTENANQTPIAVIGSNETVSQSSTQQGTPTPPPKAATEVSESQKPSNSMNTGGRGRKRSIVWEHFTKLKCEEGQ